MAQSLVPQARAVADLVRLPAVLTVPGDVLTGAAFAGAPRSGRRTAGLCAASAGLYLGGMALNDWADRRVDAIERPSRPIPSGRVAPRTALAVAAGLTGAGLGFAATAGGRRSLAAAAAIAAAACGYDLAAKATAAGPAVMAAARALDVLLGASVTAPTTLLPAAPAALVVGLHTAVTTGLSRHEAGPPGRAAEGTSLTGAPGTAAARTGAAAASRAMAGTAAVTAAGVAVAAARARGAGSLAAALALLGGYAVSVGAAQDAARRRPEPATLQRAVAAGVLGLILLEAGLLAAAGAPLPAVAVAGAWPLARALARRRAVT